MSNYVEGKVIIITGAGSGFGKLVSEMAADLGAKVVAADINEDNLKIVVEGIKAKGQSAEYVVADVTDKEQMDGMAQFAIDKFGRIDVLVNNAGIMPLSFFSEHREASKAWDKCIDINFKGVVNGISAVYDQMIAQEQGQIVNISSIYGNYGVYGSGVYSATKAAVKVLSDSLRVEAQGKIKVTTVKPTGVPGTGLGNSIINGQAILGLTGHNAGTYAENMGKFVSRKMPAEYLDSDSVKYWAISPEELAQNIIFVINQPWGVNISDITVRATGEQYTF
ncbi:SDR family oxidoreductase [Bacillus dakarensis]|uniref:SDR family oxidoreductase n=1 Tax=Robertmurraya dakarensis TaxID=1926278 RepID=UPI0009809167|nr:SDR family oxidoreductase [Bacillus dakarensis]